jgi:hypothetical protein
VVLLGPGNRIERTLEEPAEQEGVLEGELYR